MNIPEAATQYPSLDLYECGRQVYAFVAPYLFVTSVALYNGNKQRYHIVVTITKKPDSDNELYARFCKILEGPIEFGPLRLDQTYQRGITNPEPLGSPGYYDWPWRDWGWSIADTNNKILPGSGLIKDLILPGDPVILYERPQTGGNTELTEALGIPPQAETENAFIRKGNIWEVRFNGQKAPVPAYNGMRYIALLLEKPGESISCQALCRESSGNLPGIVASENDAIGEGLNIGSSLQLLGIAKGRKAVEEKYLELEDKLSQAGMEEREDIETQMNELIQYLKQKERVIPDPNDKKAQVNIRKNLSRAYEQIRAAGLKNLEEHLRKYLKPDGRFGLSYTGSITWDIIL